MLGVVQMAACAVLGAITFVEQTIPGLEVGLPNPLSGISAGNFMVYDVTGDGRADLLLPARMYPQEAGAFPLERSVTIPVVPGALGADVFGGRIYVRYADRIERVRWAGEALEVLDVTPIELAQPEANQQASDPGTLPYQSFLFDYDDDDWPELLLPAGSGLVMYRLVDAVYRPVHTLVASWAAGAAPEPIHAFAALDTRPSIPPTRAFAARVAVSEDAWWVFGRYDRSGERVQYRWERHAFVAAEGEIGTTAAGDGWTQPLPHYFQPCTLNADGIPDFAGSEWHMDPGILAPTPIFEVSATLDGGETVRRVRTRGFRSGCWFADMDGDGDADMIAESTNLARGGIRESIAKLLSSSDVTHEVRVYAQENGDFNSRPSRLHTFELTMDTAPYKMSPFFRRYRLGELVNVTGDFDGDGENDYLVHHAPDEAVVYLYAGPREVVESARITLLPEDRVGLADLNGDGRTDVVVQGMAPAAGGLAPSRVFLASPAGN